MSIQQSSSLNFHLSFIGKTWVYPAILLGKDTIMTCKISLQRDHFSFSERLRTNDKNSVELLRLMKADKVKNHSNHTR